MAGGVQDAGSWPHAPPPPAQSGCAGWWGGQQRPPPNNHSQPPTSRSTQQSSSSAAVGRQSSHQPRQPFTDFRQSWRACPLLHLPLIRQRRPPHTHTRTHPPSPPAQPTHLRAGRRDTLNPQLTLPCPTQPPRPPTWRAEGRDTQEKKPHCRAVHPYYLHPHPLHPFLPGERRAGTPKKRSRTAGRCRASPRCRLAGAAGGGGEGGGMGGGMAESGEGGEASLGCQVLPPVPTCVACLAARSSGHTLHSTIPLCTVLLCTVPPPAAPTGTGLTWK